MTTWIDSTFTEVIRPLASQARCNCTIKHAGHNTDGDFGLDVEFSRNKFIMGMMYAPRHNLSIFGEIHTDAISLYASIIRSNCVDPFLAGNSIQLSERTIERCGVSSLRQPVQNIQALGTYFDVCEQQSQINYLKAQYIDFFHAVAAIIQSDNYFMNNV